MAEAGNGSPSSQTAPSHSTATGRGEHPFDIELVKACESVVEAYRKGERSKGSACRELAKAFQFEDTADDSELTKSKQSAYDVYIGELDEIDRDKSTAELRGRRGTGDPSLEAPGPPRATGDEAEEIFGEQNTDGGHGKHRRDDSDVEDERPKHKKSVDESLFAFLQASVEESLRLSPEARQTLVLKENYTRDIAFTKQRVLCQPFVPSIPESSWNDIIADRYADLDKIFTALTTVESNAKQTFKLGELELSSTDVFKVTKHVRTHGDWVSAWTRYQEAVKFLYPCRARELTDYQLYISRLFTAVGDSRSWQVINYDKAVRGEVGRSNSLRLSDFHSFHDLYTMHIVAASDPGRRSSAITSGSSSSRQGLPRKNEPCRRYNANLCSSQQTCRYWHCCSACGGDHRLTACTKFAPAPAPDKRK